MKHDWVHRYLNAYLSGVKSLNSQCNVVTAPGTLLLAEMSKASITSVAWLSAHIHAKQWNVITHPCPNDEVQRWFSRMLTRWGRVTHICVSKIIIIGSDNGLSPGPRQAIICTNAGILFIGPLGINFSEILIRNQYVFMQENAFENIVC